MVKKASRILIVEDHAIVREGVRSLLALEPDLEVVGEADNGQGALEGVRAVKPDLILMDLAMPGTHGTEAIINIKWRYPETKIVVLTVHKADEYVHAALKAGAEGYVLKDDCPTQLLTAIRCALNGKSYLSPSICGQVVTGYLSEQSVSNGGPAWQDLTHREREVLKLVAEGYKNKEMARYLSISPKTVEKHRANLMKKLGLSCTAEVTAYAIRNGLVAKEPPMPPAAKMPG